jgi:hypothetical protein
MELSILVDLIVAALLLTTIVWAVILDRRLRDLRSGRDGLKQAIGELSAASARAEAAIAAMREAAAGSGMTLAREAQRAETLAGELRLLVGAGEGLANRMAARGTPAPAPRESELAQLRALRGAR